ncbi:MAG TPA: redoxin family protein [Candidatus Dormibacteraeota bacterium]|nr:redoxin family protein [Candidatus Dormibacteraeota bacterium]
MNRYQVGLVVVVGVVIVAAVFAINQSNQANQSTGNTASQLAGAAAGVPDPDLIPTGQRPAAPEFTGLAGWLNSPPLTVSGLRGQVLLIDFWTYSCVNCVRTLPHQQALQARYGAKGLTIIGMHSPEFDFERSQPNVAAAVKRLDVTWPVALDSRMATWNAYSNQYWPAEYVVDQQGRVAYFHAGEGDYDRTERAIVSLLGAGGTIAAAPPTAQDTQQTPELYAGSTRASHPNPIALRGSWSDHGEFVESTGPATVQLSFHAQEVYVVAEAAGSNAVTVGVTLDGKSVPDAQRGPDLASNSALTIGRSDLFHVLTAAAPRDGTIVLSVPAGFRLYTFTFG